MTELYKNTYRIPSARLRSWDYASPRAYFITICTHNRVHWFGKIENARMVLSRLGLIAEQQWMEISGHFNHVESGPFIIMPNHIHGILILNDSVRGAIHRDSITTKEIKSNSLSHDSFNGLKNKGDVLSDTTNHSDAVNRVSTMGGGVTGDKNPMLHDSVSKIIRWYKGKCTYKIRKSIPDISFQWQSRFYDHIIRDEQDFNRISEYIVNNPAQWEDDKYFSK
ncbi:MAG: transposase [Calditrichae bacterium]|nr:transposase [Calditrichia bacterium]